MGVEAPPGPDWLRGRPWGGGGTAGLGGGRREAGPGRCQGASGGSEPRGGLCRARPWGVGRRRGSSVLRETAPKRGAGDSCEPGGALVLGVLPPASQVSGACEVAPAPRTCVCGQAGGERRLPREGAEEPGTVRVCLCPFPLWPSGRLCGASIRSVSWDPSWASLRGLQAAAAAGCEPILREGAVGSSAWIAELVGDKTRLPARRSPWLRSAEGSACCRSSVSRSFPVLYPFTDA